MIVIIAICLAALVYCLTHMPPFPWERKSDSHTPPTMVEDTWRN
jgi:hypothetical protein